MVRPHVHPTRLKIPWPALAALLLTAGLVGLILPGMVVTLDDDFWYLRSVIKTIQKGRPWTDDWLTPWAASCSGISAVLFKITGSFRFAIHFQLAAAAGLTAMAMSTFLKRHQVSSSMAVVAPLLILGTPTVLFMFLMFTGVAVYMACLWWCIVLADRKKWLWFLLPWSLAVASRQSAVAWLVLPAVAYLNDVITSRTLLLRTPDARKILLLALGTILVFLGLKLGMNPTEGQKMVLGGVGQALLTSHAGIPAALGSIAFLAGLSTAALIRLPSCFTGNNIINRARLFAALPLAAAGAAAAWWFLQETQNTHDCYSDPLSNSLIPALGACLGLALALAGRKPRADATLAGLAAILLVALYGGRFDYYFNDALFLGLAAGFRALKQNPHAASPQNTPSDNDPSAASPPSPPTPVLRRPAWKSLRTAALIFVSLCAATVLLWHTGSAIKLTAQQNRAAATILLYEQAFRSGKLAPENTGMATFGYLGWLFQDYYATHEGRNQPVLGGFSRYAQNWDEGKGTGIITTLPRSLHPFRAYLPTRNRTALRESTEARQIDEIKYPFFGKHAVKFALLTGPSQETLPNTIRVKPAEYTRIPFPVNDGEWKKLILHSPPLN